MSVEEDILALAVHVARDPYLDLIERRWRGLSDGERLTLMAQCCPRCGALNEKGVTHRRPRTEPCCKAKPL